MTSWGSRLPFSFDPLVAEAKRRMRRRRLLVAGVVLLLAGGAFGAAFAFSRQTTPQGSAFSPSPADLRLSPLSTLATRRAFCGNRYSTCHSADGRWSIVYSNRSPGPISYSYSNGHVSGLPTHKVGCTLIVTNLATGRRQEIHLSAPGCEYSLFIGQTYFFQDPYRGTPGTPGGRLLGVEPPSRQVKALAYFDTYVVSADERWIAGEVDGAEGPKLIAVFSPTSHACRVVAQATSPNQVLSVVRSGWELQPARPPGVFTFKDPVAWHNVVQGGQKFQVVTGPGPGFTQDSRSVIVAEWQYRTKEGNLSGVIHRRLVKFGLSSLHTPCP
ncbi:MAG: hypothetical protein ACRDL7_03395, partial [Gaiellaceae bacterium]